MAADSEAQPKEVTMVTASAALTTLVTVVSRGSRLGQRTVDCHGSAHKPQYLARAVGSLGTARRLNIVLLNSCQAKPGQIRLQYANKILYEKEVLTAVS